MDIRLMWNGVSMRNILTMNKKYKLNYNKVMLQFPIIDGKLGHLTINYFIYVLDDIRIKTL